MRQRSLIVSHASCGARDATRSCFCRCLELEEKQLYNARRLLTEARNRFSQGLTDYLPVFTSLNIVQNLERQIVSARRDVLSARVSLHRALGGPIAPPESLEVTLLSE